MPHLRGHGTTRFLSGDTARNAQQAALGMDVVALMDALKIQTAVIGGFDWGARAANVVAALWPERCKALVSISGYLIGNQEVNKVAPAAGGRTGLVPRRGGGSMMRPSIDRRCRSTILTT